ncbi:LamG domain-containing protein [Candidatus Desantisbacteria bacterium]|nr:LamG domain-containing protein [Candidatus Desantisbacteria bacterium]
MSVKTFTTGNGNWSDNAKWGGAKPTSADIVVFDASSGNCTIDEAAYCRSIDCTRSTNYTGILTHNADTMLLIGDATAGDSNVALRFSSEMTYIPVNYKSWCNFISTSATEQTVNFKGKNTGNVTYSAVSNGNWKLTGNQGSSTIDTMVAVNLIKGNINLNGYDIHCGYFKTSETYVRTLIGGGGKIYCRSGILNTPASDSNIMGLWRMDETSGDIIDVCGLNNLTYNGSLYNQSGVLNGAIGFDGSDDLLKNLACNFNFGSNWTMSFWLYMSSSNTTYNNIMAYYPSVGAQQLYVFNTGKLNFYTNTEGMQQWDTPLFGLNQWNHVVFRTINNSCTLYINGVAGAAKTVTMPAGDATADFRLGWEEMASRQWHGYFDEVSFYSRGLTDEEIKQKYNRNLGILFDAAVSTNLTLTTPPDIILNNAGNVSFLGGSKNYGNLANLSMVGNITMSGTNTFKSFGITQNNNTANICGSILRRR